MNSDRKTINQALDGLRLRQRQDIFYLEELVKGAERVSLPHPPPLPESEIKSILAKYREARPLVPSEKDGDLPPEVFTKEMDGMPVCGIVGLHPPGKNQAGGYVNVNRVMGGTPPLPLGIAPIIGQVGEHVLAQKHVYTAGTWKGFINRLSQQMGRKTVPVRQTLNPLPKGKKVSTQFAFQLLDKYMPRKPNKNWPGVHTDLYTGLTEGIKITTNASAGPPYHLNKGEVLDKIIDTAIPIILKAIKENSLDDLWSKEPEMFLCEVKNKMDRYEVEKLDDKTRPYVCVPAHWAFLFSILSQGFQETLGVFDDTPGSSNAYGFSFANGGMDRLVQWMRSCPDGGAQGIFYGDDGKVVFRVDGKLFMADPDFKQMDGSIDKDDVRLTVDWILSHLKRDGGFDEVPNFWRAVGDVWVKMATTPHFVVDGKTVYRKKSENGLMTGIPGTTLFDTVKSVLAWNTLLGQARVGAINLMDEMAVTSWMKAQGLVVKPGTWKPVRVPPSIPGQLITDHKFLGVQTLCVEHRGIVTHVPTLPEKDALEMLICQKDNPFFTRKSPTQNLRTLFDRMRGLMITVGFSNQNIINAIHAVVNSIPGYVIIMQTQNANSPDHIGLQDFEYPDSSGFPTAEFCYDVYAGGDRSSWTQIFPGLTETLETLKTAYKRRPEAYSLAVERGKDDRLHVVGVEPPEPPPIPSEYELTEALEKATWNQNRAVFPRSRVYKYEDGKETELKYLPNTQMTLRDYLKGRGGIETVGVTLRDLGLSIYVLINVCKKFGFFLTGDMSSDLVSLHPLAEPIPTVQQEIVNDIAQNKNLIDKGTTLRNTALKAEPAMTQPHMVYVDPKYITFRHPPVEEINSRARAHAHVMHQLQDWGVPIWKPLGVTTGENPVGVALFLDPLPQPSARPRLQRVAECWSVSSKLAKDYIVSAILDLNGITPFNSSLVPDIKPPSASSSWSAQVSYEKDPWIKPTVVGLHHKLPKDPYVALQKEFPSVPPRTLLEVATANRVAKGKDWKSPTRALLSALAVTKLPTPDDADTTSKRSKYSPEKRTRLNAHGRDRKKRRLKEMKLLLSQQNSPSSSHQ